MKAWHRVSVVVALAASVTACGPRSTPNSPGLSGSELASLKVDADALDRDIDEAERAAKNLVAEWSDVKVEYEKARETYRDAALAFREAEKHAEAASATWRDAAAKWKTATERFKLYQSLIVLAAMIDAANIDAAKSSGGSAAGSGDDITNCTPMSTAAFRAMLLAGGADPKLMEKMDVDHIVPHALGGADHPSNYQMLDSSLNRSLGKSWGQEKCALAGSKCARAVAVSHKCGTFRGPYP